MAVHLVICDTCGEGETFLPMQEAMAGNFTCEQCGGPAQKVYTVPADHSENTFKARYSDNLSTGGDPVYIKSRREEQTRMKALGLQRWETGMNQDRARRVAAQQDKEMRKTFNEAKAEVLSKKQLGEVR